MEKKLEVKNLRISFRTDAGKVQAVRGIDFDLYKGETLAIVGESGSGKSVTNKAIIGISAPNAIIESGEILYDGMDLLQISEDDFHKLRGDKIAMIFQDPLSALDPINRIGMQLTEAMILKNRANRRESRSLFNRTIKNLCTAMNGAMGVDANSEQGKINKKKITDFNTFEKLHLKLEGAYNEAHTNANLAIEDIEDLLFHIEKKAVSDFGAEKSNIIRAAKKSVHEYVCADKVVALADAFKEASKGCTRAKDYTPCVEPLKALLEELKEGAAKLSPNYFALAYFFTFGKEELPKLPTDELNVYLRRYLDDNFMLAFIEDEKKGLIYSRECSLDNRAEAIATIQSLRDVFTAETLDKKACKAAAKQMTDAVAKAIDKLALVKDSTAYTFKASLNRAINTYFTAGPSNAKEEKRFNKEKKKYDKIIAKGKTPDYSVIPARIIDISIAKENILHVIDKVTAAFKNAIDNRDNYDADKEAVAIIDFLKEKAQAVAYRVTKRIAKSKALKLMEEVGIAEPKKRYRQYPFQFSGGMRQRIVIAIALAANPDILICDEPTTALDVTIQAQILELINKIKRERNLSIIFITHDLGVVANMADRIAVMYAGKIVETGTSEDVFYSPAHPYTWALLSSMPDLDTNEKLEAIPGTPPNMIYPPKGDAFAARNKYAMKIDFELQPPMFKISDTHSAATWLLHPDAPKVELPKAISARIERMKTKNNIGAEPQNTEEGEN
jgi:oligopeptide/dipeptide ABC transporter ATP-binding protein